MDKHEIIRDSFKYNSYVVNAYNLEPGKKYELYATGNADMNGRKYVALSSKPTPEEIKKYNIM